MLDVHHSWRTMKTFWSHEWKLRGQCYWGAKERLWMWDYYFYWQERWKNLGPSILGCVKDWPFGLHTLYSIENKRIYIVYPISDPYVNEICKWNESMTLQASKIFSKVVVSSTVQKYEVNQTISLIPLTNLHAEQQAGALGL